MMLKVVNSLNIQTGHHCLFSGLRHLLVSERPELDARAAEADIYFESDGLNLEYNGDLSTMWLASQETIIEQFAASYGLRAQYTFEISPNVLDVFREILLENRAVLVFMRSPYLDYHAVFRDGAERNHILLLYGIDEAGKTAFVADTSFLDVSGQTLSYSGPLSLEHVLAGVWGYAWVEADPSLSPPPTEAQRFERAVDNIRRFLGHHNLPSGRFQGLEAYRAYVEDWRRLMDVSPSEFTETCKNMYYCLRVGGMMHQLDYFEMFIGRHQDRIRNWDELARRLTENRNNWKKSLYQLYKIGLCVQPHKLEALQDRYFSMLRAQGEWLEAFVDSSNH
ncbi:hypothetical protein [Paenibacillus rigui]|nr:hypothetical protein [Paenibacillus rigui]